MVEQSFPILGVCGSNPVIGKIKIEHLFTANRIGKKKIKKKRQRWPIFIKVPISTPFTSVNVFCRNSDLLLLYSSLSCLVKRIVLKGNVLFTLMIYESRVALTRKLPIPITTLECNLRV